MKHLIDYSKFWANFPFRPVSKEQVENINFIVRKLNISAKFILATEYAYILATIKHECGEGYKPIPENLDAPWLRGKELKYAKPDPETGQTYYGRGYVQLTWKTNYKKLGDAIGMDLSMVPDAALEPEIAWLILEEGMYRGMFTGQALGKYINEQGTDFYGARKVINSLDQAFLIKKYAEQFLGAIEPKTVT